MTGRLLRWRPIRTSLRGPAWATTWFLVALGVSLLIQAGMDTARPVRADRVGVVTYRFTYFLSPMLVLGLVLLVGDPFASV